MSSLVFRSEWRRAVCFCGVLWAVSIASVVSAQQTPAKKTTLIGEVVKSGEYVAAAKAIEAFAKDDPKTFASYFDAGALADKVLQGLTAKEEIRKEFKASLELPDRSVPGQISTVLGNGGSYQLLRVHKNGDEYSALFRLSGDAGGMNYHDLKFTKGADGKIKITDLYVMLTGELMSTTLRQLVLPILVNENRTPLQKLTQKESDYVQNLPKLEEMNLASRAKDFDKVMEIYRSMPASMQQQKAVLIGRIQCSVQTQHWDETRAATAEFRRIFPGDGTPDLLTLDALVLEKKFDDALAALDRIDKFVGGDPKLSTVRAQINTIKARQ